MRGLGDFQRSQIKDVDQRIGRLFRTLRDAIDILEDMLLHPYKPRTEEPSGPAAAPPLKLEPPAKEWPPDNYVMSTKQLRELLGVSAASIYRVVQGTRGISEVYQDRQPDPLARRRYSAVPGGSMISRSCLPTTYASAEQIAV
jgi:hypothetical protein